MSGARLRALAVEFPSRRVTNEYFTRRHPDSVAREGDRALAKIWSQPEGAKADPWSEEMGHYVQDPFRGAQARRWLGPGESTIGLETTAARSALAAARLSEEEIDLMLVGSFQPEHPGIGDAAFLAQRLGLRGSAWNLESACSSVLVGMQTAAAFVQSGQARNVLVVGSCTYSRAVEETDSLAWSVGDGACAMVIGGGDSGAEIQSTRVRHTAATCGAMFYEPEALGGRLRMRSGPSAGRAIREAAHWAIDACCAPAAADAGVELGAIEHYAVTTPVAWYARFFARQIGVAPERVLNTHPLYANTGPILMPQNLFHAALEGRLKPGDRVLLHTVGSVSSAGAAVLRWGDVGLGPPPRPAIDA